MLVYVQRANGGLQVSAPAGTVRPSENRNVASPVPGVILQVAMQFHPGGDEQARPTVVAAASGDMDEAGTWGAVVTESRLVLAKGEPDVAEDEPDVADAGPVSPHASELVTKAEKTHAQARHQRKRRIASPFCKTRTVETG